MTIITVRLSKDGDHFTDSTVSKLKAKAKGGLLLSELGAPILEDYAGRREVFDRYRTIIPGNVCAKISDVWKDSDGVLYGKVEAFGKRGRLIKKAFTEANSSRLEFSIRALMTGSNVEVITFDLTKF